MSEIAVAVHNLSKIYRLYTKPLYRFLDIFGWLKTPNAYSEHAALAGINLDIRKGEKVAIIGRNGAGKSTLLKLICGAIEPTSGQIHISGKIHALLQIGTGFHPDFTGRENVYSYLANLGLSGRKADEKVREIIEFSELEEYIDQPMKTYSTGMGVRIMFATSTAITPDILVLDEVLGVGDGYFVQKSYERMRNLCETKKTTLLLVSHDVYSAAGFCDRMIWIDRGKVAMDDESRAVIRAYEASLRLQAEARLRKRALNLGEKIQKKNSEVLLEKHYFQIVASGRGQFSANISISGIKLRYGNNKACDIWMKDGFCKAGKEYGHLVLDDDEGNWGAEYCVDGIWYRDIMPFGSIFHRAPFIFSLPKNAFVNNKTEIEFELIDNVKEKLFVEAYFEGRETICKELKTFGDGKTKKICIGLDISENIPNNEQQVFNLASNMDLSIAGNCIGNKKITIGDVKLIDCHGNDKLLFGPNENLDISIKLAVADDDFADTPTAMITILHEGVVPVSRMIWENIELVRNIKTMELLAHFRPLLIGPGEYSLTVAVFESAYFEKSKGKHCASNSMVIDMRKNMVFFEVKSEEDEFYRISYVQPVEWEMKIVDN
jgi:ABC-type polysaccharide/polyol phosphate transport system ATPase subunit